MQLETARQQMIYHQIRPWDVSDPRVLDALAEVPRERFAPDQYRTLAFMDIEIPLPCGQRMLKPVVEGRLLQNLDLRKTDKVLVIGTGSGFLTACVARLADEVTSLDIHGELTDGAAVCLAGEQVRNVELQTVDYHDFRPALQFDRIVVTGSMPELDTRLVEWLKPRGKLVAIIGASPVMEVELIMRNEQHYSRTRIFETVVPALENVAGHAAFKF